MSRHSFNQSRECDWQMSDPGWWRVRRHLARYVIHRNSRVVDGCGEFVDGATARLVTTASGL